MISLNWDIAWWEAEGRWAFVATPILELAICHDIALKLNGDITVDQSTRPGCGLYRVVEAR